jgi:serine/threonine protein kinase
VSDEGAGNGFEVTLREFASGQKLFNRYRLVKTLGRGGMGVVWLAQDEELERNVALKFLPELIVHDRAVLGELKRETRRSLELTHKNIVRIYDFVHDNASGCISMEYIDGDTLSNLRADKPRKVFETNELADWISQLCDALEYAHDHARIVHRDLKPANLMVNQRGDLKVSDFGIARSLSDSVSKLTMQQGKSGTLVYMSPQQLEGERGTHLDDIYSVGASIYELLTSKPPFYSGNVDRQIREKIPPSMKQRREELEIEGDRIDEIWEDVVHRCLAKDPAKRPQSVTEVAQQLEVPSPKTRRAARVAAKKSKKLVPILVTAGFVMLLVAAAVWYLGFARGTGKGVTSTTGVAPLPGLASPKIENPPPAARNEGAAAAAQPHKRGPHAQLAPLYTGTIRVKNDPNSPPRPIAIALNSDHRSGTMTQSSKRGDVVVRFTGIWNANELRAVTSDIVSQPPGVQWTPESFNLRFADDGKSGSYECIADGKIYSADLSIALEMAMRASSVYQGTIHKADDSTRPGVPLTIVLAADRKSGTETQSSKYGATVVKFSGIWDGKILRAVTDEVVSKPKNIEWKPESFTLKFAEDWKTALYECSADGQAYSANLNSSTESEQRAANQPASMETLATSNAQPLPAQAARFAGAWAGKMKIGTIEYDITLRINPEATSLLQESKAAGQPAQHHTHLTTVSENTLLWRGGDFNNVEWTLAPNADNQTALATTKTGGTVNTAIFRRMQ